MSRSIPSIHALFSCCALMACASESPQAPIGEWRGDEPHFSVHGLLNGEMLDFSIDGDAQGAQVWCEREYAAPIADGETDLSRATHTDTRIDGYVTIAGEERVFEIEFLRHPLQDDEPGTELTVVPRVDEELPGAHELWIEWEWATIEGEPLFEAAAQRGRFVLGEFTGTPGEGGVVVPAGEGLVGGYVEARWSVNESLTVSFTVPCMENSIEAY